MNDIKIELLKGKSRMVLTEIRDLIICTIKSTLPLASNFDDIKIIEHEPDSFRLKPSNSILVEINIPDAFADSYTKPLSDNIIKNFEIKGYLKEEALYLIINDEHASNMKIINKVSSNMLDYNLS